LLNGILEKEILSTDPQVMAKYHHVTVDEIHDGSVRNEEVTLPLLRAYFLAHYDKTDGRIRITAMSATINPNEYIEYLQQGTNLS
jgi:HrpA-like RNA helicase